MYPPGREALLQDPTVAEALQQVAVEGWEQEARQFAESALAALSGRQPDAGHAQQGHKHIMLSYQWDVQEVAKRVVNELQVRGYRTWFGTRTMTSTLTMMIISEMATSSSQPRADTRLDRGADLDNMKGSTVDAMSGAVDNAEVMLSCISLKYKESASAYRSAAVCFS